MLRVLHCPTATGGHPPQVARAERELGMHSTAVTLRQDRLAYATDEVLCQFTDHPLYREKMRFALLRRALRDYDIVHFNYGQTLMPQYIPGHRWGDGQYPAWWSRVYNGYARLLEMRDLPLLKRAGKGIVVTYQGDDARQGDFCLAHLTISPAGEVEPGYYTPAADAHKRQRIARFAAYADRIYALNPDLLHVLPATAEFLPYGNVDPRQWVPRSATAVLPRRLTVLHAPTHRGVKGTRYIVEAVRRLQEHDRLDFEFILLEGLSHSEARRLYQTADLLVDQLFVGWYGGLAVECMALAKPVICYIREADLAFLPAQMRQDLPIINATAHTLYDVLKVWLTVRQHELPELGQRSRTYVEQWHDPLKIAARLQSAYEAIVASKQSGGLS